MNKDFIRPLILIISTILILGLIAALIPGCDTALLRIKPFKWFGHLKDGNSQDSLSMAMADSLLPESELGALAAFSDKMKSRNNQLRIAYFGDSIIEGDLITARLRHRFQEEFGGEGVGLVPITSVVAGFRQTIRHSFSRNWETVSFMSSGNRDMPLGWGGYVFIPRPYYTIEKPVETQIDTTSIADPGSSNIASSDTLADSLAQRAAPEPRPAAPAPRPQTPQSQRIALGTEPWVEYRGSGFEGGAREFSRIRLFYSRGGQDSYVKVSYDGGEERRLALEAGTGLHVIDLSPNEPVDRVKLSFSPHDPIHLYGVSFDQPRGAYVDNISIRGFSGLYFERIPDWMIRGFQRAMDYDLVVLQYGENVSNPKTTDYGFYYRGMMQTLAHLKNNLPGLPILVVSAHDRSVKRGGQYVTSPDIPILVQAQADMARDSDVGFWNLLEAMGGFNSMADWVNHRPALASRDYTHFNKAGADKIGDMLFEMLKKGDL